MAGSYGGSHVCLVSGTVAPGTPQWLDTNTTVPLFGQPASGQGATLSTALLQGIRGLAPTLFPHHRPSPPPLGALEPRVGGEEKTNGPLPPPAVGVRKISGSVGTAAGRIKS